MGVARHFPFPISHFPLPTQRPWNFTPLDKTLVCKESPPKASRYTPKMYCERADWLLGVTAPVSSTSSAYPTLLMLSLVHSRRATACCILVGSHLLLKPQGRYQEYVNRCYYLSSPSAAYVHAHLLIITTTTTTIAKPSPFINSPPPQFQPRP